MGLGLAGLALLVGPESLRGGGADAIGALVLVLGIALVGGRLALHQVRAEGDVGHDGHGTQMLAGGLALLVAAVVAGEPSRLDLAHASSALARRVRVSLTFGSLIGFTAYVYLLAHTTAAKASTYAYVNPVVAVLLGWAIGHETVTSRTMLAAAVILAGVAIITITRRRRTGHPRRPVAHPSRTARCAGVASGTSSSRPDARRSQQPQAGAREQRVVVEVVRAADVPLEPRHGVLAGDLARRVLDVALRVSAALQVVRRVRRVPACGASAR